MDKEKNIKNIEYTLLENALDFLNEAVKRYRVAECVDKADIKNVGIFLWDDSYSTTKKRSQEISKNNIKYAILHLSSGIELLLKYLLYREHWAYIVNNIDSITKEKYQKGDFGSVNMDTAIGRLETLCEINIPIDAKHNLKRIKEKRNQLEHFKINETLYSIIPDIMFGLEFSLSMISENGYDDVYVQEKLLIDKLKSSLIKIAEYKKKRIDIIDKEISQKGISRENLLVCPYCGEKYYEFFKEDGHCLCCLLTASPTKLADMYLIQVQRLSLYRVKKEGERWPRYLCPLCGEDALVVDENGDYYCYGCKDRISHEFITKCGQCNELVPNDIVNTYGLCPICEEWREAEFGGELD